MMPDIQDMLGQQPKEQEIPESENNEENPLKKMDEISKSKSSTKKDSDKSLDEDSILEMLMTGDNTDGMFEPEVPEEEDGVKLHEEVDDKAKGKIKGEVKPKGKYENDFKNDMLKNPDDYKVMTPKGEMTVAEAFKQGYNPITKRFDKSKSQEEIKNKHMKGLNEADKAKLEEFINPKSAKVPPKDAAKYGLKDGSNMIASEEGVPPTAIPAMPQAPEGQAPAGLEAMLGQGGAAPAPIPQGGSPAPQTGGSPDLTALLGGGN